MPEIIEYGHKGYATHKCGECGSMIRYTLEDVDQHPAGSRCPVCGAWHPFSKIFVDEKGAEKKTNKVQCSVHVAPLAYTPSKDCVIQDLRKALQGLLGTQVGVDAIYFCVRDCLETWSYCYPSMPASDFKIVVNETRNDAEIHFGDAFTEWIRQ